MQIAKNTVVTFHYSVHSKDVLLDSSLDGNPLQIIFGTGHLIPGLEAQLEGKVAGDEFKAEVKAEHAYGERVEHLMQAVPLTMFTGMDVQPGMSFRATSEDGAEQSVVVLDVTEDEVIIDGNHPLAGMDLQFDVNIISVREATADELAHGHVHAAGGCGGHHHHHHEQDHCCGGHGHGHGHGHGGGCCGGHH